MVLFHQVIALHMDSSNGDTVIKEEEWKARLTYEQYDVLRRKGTERPFSGKLLHNKGTGTYNCAACGNVLFSSKDKFDSGSGWPSFKDVVSSVNVLLKTDGSHGMERTEVRCARCGGHLGHLFEDGPGPKGLRYCINSVSLDFKPEVER